MSWTCPICAQQHSADAACSTVPPQGSGTTMMAGSGHTPPGAAEALMSPAPAPAPVAGAAPAGAIEPPVDPLLGTTIGSFRIVRCVGKGGMGTVYLGEQTVIGSKVAIKILHDHLASNPGLVQRFYSEARAVNLIGHENIVNIFDMNVVPPNRYYLIMEFLEGRPLNEAIRGAMPAEVAIPILLQICDGLQAAHTHGVVHRDLKPENIYLIKRGRNENFVKILDFGIAKLFATDVKGETTNVGTIVGTPEYMAPEQTTGDKIDGRSDIYSLGVIAYLMATGRLPFSGGGLAGMLIAHQQKVPDAPMLLNPRVPAEWSAVIMRALAKRPDDRYADADAFGTALADVLGAVANQPLPRQGVTPAPGAHIAGTGAGPRGPTPQPTPIKPFSSADAATPQVVMVAPPGAPPITGAPSRPSASAAPPPAAAAPLPAMVASPAPSTPAPAVVAQSLAANLPTPQPAFARHAAKFDAIVTLPDGKSLGSLPCQDISKGGLFLCTDGVMPAVFARVKIKLPVAGDLECFAEVVRHVLADQARTWGMSPGFGVQFLNLTPAQREVLGRVVQGLPVAKATAAPRSDDDDAVASQVIAQYSKRINGDHYVVLGLPPDAEFSEVRARGRDQQRELEALKERPLSTSQRELIDSTLARLQQALAVVGAASPRLAYDANHGNYRGVARSIAAGLTVTEIDAARRTYLDAHPGAETNGHVKFVTGNAYENRGALAMALENYEAALGVDPLNLRAHQRYWALKRKQQDPKGAT